jgi:hypothetical protein
MDVARVATTNQAPEVCISSKMVQSYSCLLCQQIINTLEMGHVPVLMMYIQYLKNVLFDPELISVETRMKYK